MKKLSILSEPHPITVLLSQSIVSVVNIKRGWTIKIIPSSIGNDISLNKLNNKSSISDHGKYPLKYKS